MTEISKDFPDPGPGLSDSELSRHHKEQAHEKQQENRALACYQLLNQLSEALQARNIFHDSGGGKHLSVLIGVLPDRLKPKLSPETIIEIQKQQKALQGNINRLMEQLRQYGFDFLYYGAPKQETSQGFAHEFLTKPKFKKYREGLEELLVAGLKKIDNPET